MREQVSLEFILVAVYLLATRTEVAALGAAQKGTPEGGVVHGVLRVDLENGLLHHQLFLAHRVSGDVPFQIVRSGERPSISRARGKGTALGFVVSRTRRKKRYTFKIRTSWNILPESSKHYPAPSSGISGGSRLLFCVFAAILAVLVDFLLIGHGR